jgi:endonuclease/exonuclease/phosphatase family metal-dependent hydrolase
LRKYKGRLVKEKPAAERKLIADRIKRMDLDVLAVQEVEDIDTLRQFVREDLKGLYRHSVLIEGNDPRLIDVGLLSKRPLRGVTSWQHVSDPLDPSQPVFSRDLLQVQVLKQNLQDVLLTIFVNHLKSHYVPFDAPDPEAETKRANELRQRQCEVAAAIIASEMRPNSRYLVVGDMNDPPDSEFMAPLTASPELKLVSGLADAKETRPGPKEPAAADHSMDGTLQSNRQTSPVHAYGPGLAQSRSRPEANERLHRAAQQGRRGRKRPRSVVGPSRSLAESP